MNHLGNTQIKADHQQTGMLNGHLHEATLLADMKKVSVGFM